MKPLNPESEPTPTGWSEVTLFTGVANLMTRTLVVKIFADTQPFAFPRDAGNPISCYKTAEWN